jgi:hypothetical protein
MQIFLWSLHGREEHSIHPHPVPAFFELNREIFPLFMTIPQEISSGTGKSERYSVINR